MSTASPSLSIEVALGAIPSGLRKRLLKSFTDVKSALAQGQFDACGLRAGKFCEVMLRALQHELTNSHTPLGTSLGNFKVECEKLEQTPKSAGAESLRVILPRALNFLYTLRNKRDIGHVGGDVDANEIDSLAAARVADWCMCELIRVLHSLPLEDAQILCDAISERRVPAVWNVLGRRRVLNTEFSYRDQTLLLLYTEIEKGVPIEDLFAWTEHSRFANFKRDILGKLHGQRLIEWDRETDMAVISPSGIREVEQRLLPEVS